ncbi:MAG: lytic transglycosylase domain-containing protein [Georgfuchsia sp.]
MSTQTLLKQPIVQKIESVLNAMNDSRLLPGLIVSIALMVFMAVQPASFGQLISQHQNAAPVEVGQPAGDENVMNADAEPNSKAAKRLLTREMSAALDFAARRYRVSASVLEPAFIAAQQSAREYRIDPLLIVAVIAIESRFNPYAESNVGAQGFMQVMPRWHQDKISAEMGKKALFNPETNVRIGAQILHESIQREGSLIAGLQQYAGASDDPQTRYANKVFAEKQKLEAAVQRI